MYMKAIRLFTAVVLAMAGTMLYAQQTFTVNAKKPGAPIQPTMYGIFFEDINFGADGGLYAEMVQNRSFEFPQQLMGWNAFGNVTIDKADAAFSRNPHYAALAYSGHREKHTGLENHGFFGMGLKAGMKYNFTVWARTSGDGDARIRVELISHKNDVMNKQRIDIKGRKWTKYTATLKSPVTDAKGGMRIFLEGKNGVHLDHVSLFPQDSWKGLLRADLVKDLKDLHPGIFRFPGGCIVEGTELATRYQWKNSVGPAEDRPLNENRWNYTFAHRLFPNYYQTYGLGFYEFFLLSEEIGAAPLPILSVGLSCQYQNSDDDPHAHVAVGDLQPYIDDALDLIEFANGATDTKWGGLRASMGHPEPFNLEYIGIGNEQWGPMYPERLEKFVSAIRAKYPKVKIVGSAGPSPDDNDGKQFTYGWEQMRRLKVDLVDEHYYRNQDWFLENATRYDSYDRKGPKVFAGEYACHVKEHAADFPTAKNVFDAALSEAALMTGLERNADVVYMATYAPLFAHVEGWQWRPDLIWMDNLTTVRTPNYYVQQMFACNKGTHVLKVEGSQGPLFVSAVYDKPANGYVLKIVNTSSEPQPVAVTLKGVKVLGAGTVTSLHADRPDAANTIEQKYNVVPTEGSVQADGNVLRTTIPAKTFSLFRF